MHNKVAVFSDLHLGVHQNSDFWLNIASNWIDWFTQSLDENNIETIIFCGDFFHYRSEISVKTLDFSKKILDRLEKYNLYMITGNHDVWYKDTSDINSLSIFKGRKNINVFDTQEQIIINNKTCYMNPWGSDINKIKKSDYIFGHFELKDFYMNNYKICENGLDPKKLTHFSNLIFSGHFHRGEIKQINNSEIIYTGNPFQMDFGDETLDKGYYILDTNNDSYEFVKNNISPLHIKLFLSKLVQIEDPLEYFNNIIKNNIIKLIVDKNISVDHLDMLVQKILFYKPNDIKIDYDTNYNKIYAQEVEDYNISSIDIKQAIAEFVELVNVEDKENVVKYTQQLYDSVK